METNVSANDLGLREHAQEILESEPLLDQIASSPGLATMVKLDTALLLLMRCTAVQAALLGVLQSGGSQLGPARSKDSGDVLLDVRETAIRLKTSVDYLYRNAKRLPFTVRHGRALRFSSRGIDQWIEQQQKHAQRSRKDK